MAKKSSLVDSDFLSSQSKGQSRLAATLQQERDDDKLTAGRKEELLLPTMAV